MNKTIDFNKARGASVEEMHEELSQELAKAMTPKMVCMLLAMCVATGELPALEIIGQGRAAEVFAGISAMNRSCLEWLETMGVNWKRTAIQIQAKYGMEDEKLNQILQNFVTTTMQ